MGKKNNVNPDHYKTAGRELPGQDIVHEIHKQKFTQAQAQQKNEFGSEYIPGENPENVTETPVEEVETGEVNKSANSSSNT